MNSPRKPSVLFVFYTHTEQSRRVADAMASVLRERGCDVWMAGIEFTDPRYAGKFDRFPFRHAVLDLTSTERTVIARRFGFDGQPPSNLSQLHDQLGMSRREIREILLHGLTKLRGQMGPL